MMFKVIVAGGRDLDNYELMCDKLDALFVKKDDVCIVSGDAKGADGLGEVYANERNLECKIFVARWSEHGRSAGFKRNVEMAEYANALVAFWDGKSKGTAHMIETAREKGLAVRVVRY